MYATYAVFSRLFCPAIKKSIKNKNLGNVETTKKIKNLMQVSKFFKIFTTSGDGVLSFLSGVGIAVILTGSLLLELFAFGIALKVALVVSSVLLFLFLASGIFGVVSLVTPCIKKALKDKEMKKEIENRIEKNIKYCNGIYEYCNGIYESEGSDNDKKWEGLFLLDVKDAIKDILEKNKNDKNSAIRMIIKIMLDRTKDIYKQYNKKKNQEISLESLIYEGCYMQLILREYSLPSDDKFYEEELKDISIDDKVYEKILQFYNDKFSFCKNETENKYRVAEYEKFVKSILKIIKKMSDEKKKKVWADKINKNSEKFKKTKKFKKILEVLNEAEIEDSGDE